MLEASDAIARRRLTLIVIVLATLPCYCVGWLALILAPDSNPVTPTPTAVTAFTATPAPLITSTLGIPTISFTPNIITGTATETPTFTLTPTNTASITPSPTNFPPASYTPTFTFTPSITPSLTPSNTFTPTLMPSASFTPTPSFTSAPTNTSTLPPATSTPSLTPFPTTPTP